MEFCTRWHQQLACRAISALKSFVLVLVTATAGKELFRFCSKLRRAVKTALWILHRVLVVVGDYASVKLAAHNSTTVQHRHKIGLTTEQ